MPKSNLRQYLCNNKESLDMLTVMCDPSAICSIKQPSVAVQLAAVKADGLLIQHIKNPCKKVQLAAVKENPLAIRHIECPD